MIVHRSFVHDLSSCEITAWNKFRSEQDLTLWPLQYWLLYQLSYQAIWELKARSIKELRTP